MENGNQKPVLSHREVIDKLLRYCDYQERCTSEIYRKLKLLGIEDESQQRELIKELLEMDILNESRFADSFARGKFKIKKWGFGRIRNELKYRGITENLIEIALSKIDEADYQVQFEYLAIKKWELLKAKSIFEKKAKFYKYFYNKGYSGDMIVEFLKYHSESTN